MTQPIQTTVHVFKPTDVRRYLSDPVDLVGPKGTHGHFVAYYQRRTDEEVVEGNDRNNWWVRVATPAGDGWVTAVHIDTGGSDAPVPGVYQAPQYFD